MRAGGELDAVVTEVFAQAHQLTPGSHVTALVNGKQRRLLHHGHGAVARVHLRRHVGHARRARVRRVLARRGRARRGAGHAGRVQPRGHQARARRVAAGHRRRGEPAARRVRRIAGERPRRPGLARDARLRDPRAAGARHGAALDLPGRGRVPAACRHGAAGRDPARAGGGAQGARVSQPHHRPALPQADHPHGRRRLAAGPGAGKVAGYAR